MHPADAPKVKSLGVLTTNNGAPIDNNQTSQTAGANGPLLFQETHLMIDKLGHFDRERVPERVVHAKGAGAHGYFEVTHDISHLTCAKFLNKVGKRTPLFARFSTVAGERGSADTARDPRGFALKFYTEEGNWDMVGNNTPVFFVRDPSKFVDFMHALKRNPQTHLRDPNMFWDFLSLVPESVHQVTILFSDRGTPDGHRHMNGFSNHSYILVSEDGSYRFAKWHFLTNQGIKNLIDGEAERLAGINPEYATEDLFNAIERGDYPSWDVYIQVIEPEQALKYHFNHLDITKVLRHRDFPLIPVGRMVLNRNPENYFAEVEQAAFSPSHLVPGIAPAPDRMFQSRLFSYPDTLRHRIGGNYHQIPVNRPINSLPNNHQCDGLMVVDGNGGSAPIYEPNSFGGPYQTNNPIHTYVPLNLHGQTGRYAFELTDDDFVQAGDLYRLMDPAAQTRLVNNLVNSIIKARPFIQKRMVGHFKRADPEYGARVERGLHEAGSEI